jgi:hypothetical protein
MVASNAKVMPVTAGQEDRNIWQWFNMYYGVSPEWRWFTIPPQ